MTTELPVTALVARRAAELDYALIPAEIRAVARQCFLDWFAVTLAGSREELSQIIAAEAALEGEGGSATLVGLGRKTAPLLAALVNGTTSHALDYDDIHLSFLGHPTVTLVPAILAAGETAGASGRDLLTAFVAGYETICRVGLTVAPGHYGRGFHATATAGSFGAAAACARLMRLDPERTAIALGIAATQAAGLKSMFGTMCKPLHAGKAAQNGLLAARLAARGFTSRPDAVECAQGFAATQAPAFRPEAALEEPPGGYYLRGNLFKYHAACYLTHAAIECARAIATRPGFAPEQIAKIVVRIDRGADKVCNILSPRTGLELKFSLRFTVALALSGLDTASLATYTDARTQDPELKALAGKVEIAFERGWDAARSELTATLTDGSVLEATHDAGVPAADVAAQGRHIEAKFLSLAEPVLGAPNARRLAAAIGALDELRHTRDLMALAG
ncbi:MAG TPA: MmgE/PrpD family protein [Stellaceae bacterium]|nr:MmgE/PrpD family protein [Stellaceae bacterium]